MTDKRWNALGESLVNYSLNIQPGEKLMIAMYEVETYPLAVAVYGACIRAGGFPQIQFMSETLKHKVLQYGNDAQISWIPEIEAYGMEWADCYIALRGAFNLNECFDIPAEKLARYQKAMGVISSLRWQKTRWALVRVPNERFAQQANVSYERIMDMFFDACNLDWPKEIARWRRIAGELDKGSRLRLVGRGTDLSFSFDGNPWEVSENKGNIPDGEIMVTPKWATVNGKIFFEFPATLGGQGDSQSLHHLRKRFGCQRRGGRPPGLCQSHPKQRRGGPQGGRICLRHQSLRRPLHHRYPDRRKDGRDDPHRPGPPLRRKLYLLHPLGHHQGHPDGQPNLYRRPPGL